MRFRPTGRIAALFAVTVAVLVPLGVFGAPALARTASALSEYGSGSSQYQYKVAVCHHTHSKKHPFHVIMVGAPAVKAHLRHGDTLAPCPTTAPAAPVTGHGHANHGANGQGGDNGKAGTNGQSGDHGNSGDHGKGHGK